MKLGRARWVLLAVLTTGSLLSQGQEKRKIIIDQDAAGPAGTDQQSLLLLIQSPQTEVLGITVVTGDAWLKSEVAHTLRTLELIGRTDIPVVSGAEYPLVRRKRETELWEQRFGSVAWVGAWTVSAVLASGNSTAPRLYARGTRHIQSSGSSVRIVDDLVRIRGINDQKKVIRITKRAA